MVSELYQYGGTVDIYAKINGVYEIIDIKTGSGIYSDYFFQVTAYMELLRENGYEVERARILNIPRADDEGFIERFVPKPDVCFKVFKNLRETYQLLKEVK